jgi:hypothetical protein
MLLNELKNPVSKMNAVGEFNLSRAQRVMFEAARRSLAGMWFALAAGVPVAYYFLAAPLFGGKPMTLGGSVILTGVLSSVVFGFCGLTLGSDILNAAIIKSRFQAVKRGLVIGGLCYLLLFTGLAVILAVSILAGSIDAILVLIFLEAVLFLYGWLVIGWVLAAVGAAAGGLLYLCRVKCLGA